MAFGKFAVLVATLRPLLVGSFLRFVFGVGVTYFFHRYGGLSFILVSSFAVAG